MSIDEVLKIIKAFFEALLNIIKTLKGEEKATDATGE